MSENIATEYSGIPASPCLYSIFESEASSSDSSLQPAHPIVTGVTSQENPTPLNGHPLPGLTVIDRCLFYSRVPKIENML
ncbi:MAG: hypothetical protein ACQES4_12195 [Bacillota bacterium]